MAVFLVSSFFWAALRAFSSELPSVLGFWCLFLLSFFFSFLSLGLPLFGSFLLFCLIGFVFLGWGGLLVTVAVIIIINVSSIRFLEVIFLLLKAVAFLIGVFVHFKYNSITYLNINNDTVNIVLQVLVLKQIICLSYGSGATTLGTGLKRNVRLINVKCDWQNSHTWLLHSIFKGIIDSYVNVGGSKSRTRFNLLLERQPFCCLIVGNIRVAYQNVQLANVNCAWQNRHQWLHFMVKCIIHSYVKDGGSKSLAKFITLFERQIVCCTAISNFRVINQTAIRGNFLLILLYLLANHQWLHLTANIIIDSNVKGGGPKSHAKRNPLFEKQIVCRITISTVTNLKAIQGNLLLTSLYFLKDQSLVVLFGAHSVQIVVFLLIFSWQTAGVFVFLFPLSFLY